MDREGAGDREAEGRHAAGVPEIQIPTESHEGLNVRKFRILSLLMAKARVPFRGHFLGVPHGAEAWQWRQRSRMAERKYLTSKVRSSGCALLEQP